MHLSLQNTTARDFRKGAYVHASVSMFRPGQGSSPNSTNTQSNCSSYGDMNGDAETDTVEKPLSIRLSGVAVSLIDAHPRELLYLAIQVKCLE